VTVLAEAQFNGPGSDPDTNPYLALPRRDLKGSGMMVANSIEWRGVPDSDDDVSIPLLRGVAEVTSESRWSNLDALYIRFVVLLVRNVATRCTPLSLGHTLALCCCSRDIHVIQVHAQTLEAADNAASNQQVHRPFRDAKQDRDNPVTTGPAGSLLVN
jgi:hypothetical protein